MNRLRLIVLAVSAFALLCLAGCGSAGYFDGSLMPAGTVGYEISDMDMRAAQEDAPKDSAPDTGKADGTGTGERKKVYTALTDLEVADVEKTKDKITEFVTTLGGFVDAVSENGMSVRVPYTRFDETVAWTLTLGRVIRNEIQNYDVTEFFSDTESRLKLATETRKRLNQLLSSSTDVEERVAILREIRRLTEVIESLQQTLRVISESVEFSRIDIGLVSLLSGSDREGVIPFGWIAALNPAVISVEQSTVTLPLNFGPEFAVIDQGPGQSLYAESSRGVQVRQGSVKNRPIGDIEFWEKALIHHVSPLYAKAEQISYGTKLRGLRLTSFDINPYIYEVLVQVSGDYIIVCEVYFPTLAHYESTGKAIDELFQNSAGEVET